MKSTQPLLSAIILTKNEEKNISRCLDSLSFCDERIVIDDYSTDNTLLLVRKFKAKIYKHSLSGDFSAQRNYGLKKSKGEWVLFVDADEVVSSELSQQIKKEICFDHYSGYFIRRRDVLWNRQLKYGEVGDRGAFGNGRLLRLARKDAGVWKRKIHEYWNISGSKGELNSLLFHYPHQTLTEFISRIETRSQNHAESVSKEGKRPYFYKILIWPLGKFIYNFIIKLGFLDGIPGFLLAVIMSFHSFISWSYLWLNHKSLK